MYVYITKLYFKFLITEMFNIDCTRFLSYTARFCEIVNSE